MKPEEVYGGQGSIKWKITKACFYADAEAEKGEPVAGVNSEECVSDNGRSRGNWIQTTSRKNS